MLPPRASFRTTGMPRRRRAIGSVCAPCTLVTPQGRPTRLPPLGVALSMLDGLAQSGAINARDIEIRG